MPDFAHALAFLEYTKYSYKKRIVFFAPFWSRGFEFERLKRIILNNTIQPKECVKFSQVALLKKSLNINEKQHNNNKQENKQKNPEEINWV